MQRQRLFLCAVILRTLGTPRRALLQFLNYLRSLLFFPRCLRRLGGCAPLPTKQPFPRLLSALTNGLGIIGLVLALIVGAGRIHPNAFVFFPEAVEYAGNLGKLL